MRSTILAALGAATILFGSPAAAQQSTVKPGPLWTAVRIDVEDGQFENYMDFVTKTWMDNQAFAKSQGWLLDYWVLESVNPRDNEPNIILITRYNDFPSAKEIEQRNDIMNKRMQLDDRGQDAASGQRGSMRKLMGSVMYRELQKR